MVKQKNNSNGNKTTGDIPRSVKHTFDTVSCTAPRIPNTYTFRGITNTVLSVTSASAVNTVYSFSLNSLDNAITLSGLFDVYRIDAVRITFLPQTLSLNAAAVTTYSPPLHIVIDYDDATALSSEAEARQYDNDIVLTMGQSCSRMFAPRSEITSALRER
jgi:hypothetical protein